MEPLAVRFAPDSDDVLEGIGIPFDGPFLGKDLHHTRFTPNTDYCFDWFPSERPLLYDHGLQGETGTSVVGRVRSWEVRNDIGVWVQLQLDKANSYYEGIRQLIKDKKLFLSSGAMGHLVEEGRNGEMIRWPWIELSLTPTPSNAYATVDFAEAGRSFRSAGIEFDEDAIRAKLDAALKPSDPQTVQDAKPDPSATRANAASDTVDYERSFEDIRDDISGLLNHQSPFMQDDSCCYSYVVATFPDYVIVNRSEEGDSSYWKIAYTIGPDQEPVLGDATEMDLVYVPAAARCAAAPLTLDALSVTRRAAALHERTQDLMRRREAEDRPLSRTNRDALRRTAEALRATAQNITTLADRADGLETEAAKVARFADPAARRVLIEVLELEASLYL